MAATAAMIATVRRYVADVDGDVFEDADIQAAIERYPFADADGLGPQDAGWEPRYDLNHAAYDLWLERAARAAAQQSAAGGVVSRIEDRGTAITYASGGSENAVSQAERMAAIYRKRIAPRWVRL